MIRIIKSYAFFATFLILASAQSVSAADVSDFYKDKTLTFIVGFDVYGGDKVGH